MTNLYNKRHFNTHADTAVGKLSLGKYFNYENANSWIYLGVKTCEVFLCFVAIVRVRAIVLTSLFSLFYVTGECHRFLHRGWAKFFIRLPHLSFTHQLQGTSTYKRIFPWILFTDTLCLRVNRGKGWFTLAHKHNISIASENTRDISIHTYIHLLSTSRLGLFSVQLHNI